MKKIGLIGAMEQEVAFFKESMEAKKIKTIANMEFCEGTLNGKDIVAVMSGIGKVNAAICTQILKDIYNVDAVINTGIAGSLRNHIEIGDIVLSTDALQHDMDARAFGYDLGVIPREETSIFKADKALMDMAKSVCDEYLKDTGIHLGRVVSGDQFIADNDKKVWIQEYFDALCTEMEGAAIAQAAYLNNIPFLIIRSISDKADQSAEMDYDEFEKLAISRTITLVMNLMKNL